MCHIHIYLFFFKHLLALALSHFIMGIVLYKRPILSPCLYSSPRYSHPPAYLLTYLKDDIFQTR